MNLSKRQLSAFNRGAKTVLLRNKIEPFRNGDILDARIMNIVLATILKKVENS